MFVIKKHYKATESNPNFAGHEYDAYYGAQEHQICDHRLPTFQEAKAWGFKTLAGARRGLKLQQELAEWETSLGHWVVTVQIDTEYAE